MQSVIRIGIFLVGFLCPYARASNAPCVYSLIIYSELMTTAQSGPWKAALDPDLTYFAPYIPEQSKKIGLKMVLPKSQPHDITPFDSRLQAQDIDALQIGDPVNDPYGALEDPTTAHITSVALSPMLSDGSREIAVGDEAGNVTVYPLGRNTPRYWLPHRDHAITGLRYSPSGQFLLSVAGPEWLLSNGKDPVRWGAHHAKIQTFTTTYNDTLGHGLITSDAGGSTWYWAFEGVPKYLHPSPASVKSVIRTQSPATWINRIGNSTETLITEDRKVRVFNIRDGKITKEMNARHEGTVSTGDFSIDHRKVLAVDNAGMGRVWFLNNETCSVIIDGSAYGKMVSGHFIRDGKYALTAHQDGKVRIWDVRAPSRGQRTAKLLVEFEGHHAPITALYILPGTHFLTLAENGEIGWAAVPRISGK